MRAISEMAGSPVWVMRMLDDLMFPWMSLGLLKEWMWATPLAAPKAILTRVSQSKGGLPVPRDPKNVV